MSTANQKNLAGHVLADSDDAISCALTSARESAEPLSDFPGAVPESMQQAYAIQSASIARWPDTVAGWKVGMLSAEDQGRHSTQRLAGPIFRSQIHDVASGSHATMPIFVGGFAAIEAEFIFKLAETIMPNERAWSDDELARLIQGLHIGAEIASSPMAEVNNLGPTVVASDFGNNAGLLVGPAIPDWQSLPPADLPARVVVDGSVVGEASAAAIPGGPMGALQFVVGLAASRDLELPAGTLISTGACTGIHDIEVTSNSRVEFGDFGAFDVSFEPMAGKQ